MDTVSYPILSCEAAAQWEAQLLGNDLEKTWEAMNRAGRGAGEAILADFSERAPLPRDPRLLILVGTGHNGGDALLAADQIVAMRPRAEVAVVFPLGKDKLKPLTQRALEVLKKRAHVALQPAEAFALAASYDIVIDGVLGMSFKPPIRDGLSAILETVNQNPNIRFRAAIDVPSGVSESTQAPAFIADFTYATGIAKEPLFKEASAAATGRIRFIDIGFFEEPYPEVAEERIILSSILEPLKRLRPASTHKRSFGHLLIVSGSKQMPGALLMCVQGAIRSGLGLVTVFAPDSVCLQLAPSVPEAMWIPCPESETGSHTLSSFKHLKAKLPDASALLIGPGLTREGDALALACQIVESISLPILVDADALQVETVAAAAKRPKNYGAILMTPHAGEFKRISQKDAASNAALREFCKETGIATLLKGCPTRICKEGPLYYCPFGGPVLARGGSGDILSGLIGGLLAQRPTDLPETILAQGAAWHGMAADLLARNLGQQAVRTTELLPFLAQALR